MAAFESKLQRLEERAQAQLPPGMRRSTAEEIKLQEQIVGACYSVRAAAGDMEADGAWKRWPPGQFDKFADGAEVELIQHQRALRELTRDDDAAWEARLARIEQEAQAKRERIEQARGRRAAAPAT